jgi:hypothetical protein
LNQRGIGRTGCLLALLLVVATVYFGLPIAGTYIRYFRFKNEMQTQARFAPSIDDDTIRRRLFQTVDDLGVPDTAKRIRIRRTSQPLQIQISTEWEETIVLPFYTREITLRLEVRERM